MPDLIFAMEHAPSCCPCVVVSEGLNGSRTRSGFKVRSSFRRHGRCFEKKDSCHPKEGFRPSAENLKQILICQGKGNGQTATPCRALRIVDRHAAAGVARSQRVHHLSPGGSQRACRWATPRVDARQRPPAVPVAGLPDGWQ